MKKSIVVLVMVGLLSSMSMPAFAIKPLNDKFTEIYNAADEKDVPAATKDAFKEAKCNICHAGADKKKRNPYGQAVGKQLKETKFDLADFKKNPNNYTDKLKEIFKKVGEEKAGKTDKTFAARMKEGMLPGGDKDGKGLE